MKLIPLSLLLAVAATLAVDVSGPQKLQGPLAQRGFDYVPESCDFSRITVRNLDDIKAIVDSPEWNECKKKSSMEGKDFQFPELVWFQDSDKIPCAPKAADGVQEFGEESKGERMIGDSVDAIVQSSSSVPPVSEKTLSGNIEDQANAPSKKALTEVLNPGQTEKPKMIQSSVPSESCRTDMKEMPSTVAQYISCIKDVLGGCIKDGKISLLCYVPMKGSISRILERYNPANVSPKAADQIADHINDLLEQTSTMDFQATEWCNDNSYTDEKCKKFSREAHLDDVQELYRLVKDLKNDVDKQAGPQYAHEAKLKTYNARWQALDDLRRSTGYFARSFEGSEENLGKMKIILEKIAEEFEVVTEN